MCIRDRDYGTDGGVHNFLRYLEGWGGTLYYEGSIVSFYYNQQAVGIYKCCNIVYGPPTRNYQFDTNFLTPSLLPPATDVYKRQDKYGPDKLYDEGSTVIEQKLSQIQGVGQVTVGGGALPAVRVDANPTQLASYGLTLASLQSVLSLQNSNLAKGQITDGDVTADILANDQISHAVDYKPLVVGYNNGAAVHLSDVADVTDSVANVRAGGYLNNKRAITVVIFRQPGANIIDTVDRIRAQLPFLEASIPFGINAVSYTHLISSRA